MPSNWMSLHSAQPRQPGDVIHGRAEATTERIARRWIDRRIHWFTWNNLYEFIGGALLLYISFLYLIVGRFMLAKLFFANRKCDDCGLCREACPFEAIRIVGGKPWWTLDCESCMRCMGLCPRKAVEAIQSMAAVYTWLVFGLPLSVWIAALIPCADWLTAFLQTDTGGMLLLIAATFLVLFAFYPILHYGMRLPFLRPLFEYSTLTRWYRRYHEKHVKLGTLAHQIRNLQNKDRQRVVD